MGKKKKKSVPIQMKQKEQPMVIDMMTILHNAHPYTPTTFKTGAHSTYKDKPRQKRWHIEDY